jgi:Raf kinase inhibitor-like YbhB/YbcL family protein
MRSRLLFAFATGVLLLTACSANGTTQPADALPPTKVPTSMVESGALFELTSAAFGQGEPIPPKFSCGGEDVSPPLAWGDPPTGTQSLALIMDDPDAPGGTWDHWILFNISPDFRELQENLPISGKNQDPEAIFVGNNSWGRPDYGGPCPPSGTHRYFFKLYALDRTINLLPGATKGELLNSMDGHILAEDELMGTFTR